MNVMYVMVLICSVIGFFVSLKNHTAGMYIMSASLAALVVVDHAGDLVGLSTWVALLFSVLALLSANGLF